MYSELKIVNEFGGIQAQRISDDVTVYLAPGTVEHDEASSGRFGPVSPYIPPAPPIPSVPDLSFPQLLIGLVAEGWITEVDGEAWLTGTLPAAVLGVISTLPVEMQFPAKARALRPSVIIRADPLVAALAASEGKTPEELDEFFFTYSQV